MHRGGEHGIAGRAGLPRGYEERAGLRDRLGVAPRQALLERIARDLDVVAEHARILGAEELP